METVKQTVDKHIGRLAHLSRPIGHARLARLFVAGLVLWSIVLPVAGWVSDRQSYMLSAATQSVIGEANANLSAKFSYNPSDDVWQFNKDGQAVRAATIARMQGTKASDVGAAMAQLQAQVGGAGKTDTSLYSVDLPTKAAQGMTFYENQTNQSFKLIPQFKVRDGKKWQGRVVYPFGNGGQIVYTAKSNGIKEDIVLNKNIGDNLQFSYKLELPNTLEAKLGEDGSIGIYSADPTLYSNMSYAADADRLKVESARESAQKDHLVFGIPAPVINDANGKKLHGEYTLRDGIVQVNVNNLNSLSYPLSVDPSVVLTSSTEFESGNNEGGIDFSTSGQMGVDTSSGATLTGGWLSTSTGTYTARYGLGTAAYNGYLYAVGGQGASGPTTDVDYAPINSNGTIGAWASTTALTTARTYPGVVAYNGYLYIYGGWNTGASALGTVDYAPINSSTGALGSWTTSSNAMATASCRFGMAVYNGYLYAIGGNTGTVSSTQCGNASTPVNTVQFAPFKANGDVGAWSTSANTFTNARMSPASVAYNGFLYLNGGTIDGTTAYKDTLYAPILSNGDVGAWITSTPQLPTAKYRHAMVAYKGFMYVFGGNAGAASTDTQYARINANGSIDNWQTTASFTTGRFGHIVTAYKGNLYLIGGVAAGVPQNDTQRAVIDPAGTIGSQTAGASTTGTGLNGGYAFAANGYLYRLGGGNTTTPINSVQRATLDPVTGVIGTWGTTGVTNMNTASAYGGWGYYNNRIYIFGGNLNSTTTAQNTIQYATVNPDGTLGSWTTNSTGLETATGNHSGTIYNGYLYYVGNSTGSAGTTNLMHYTSINKSTGAVNNTWSTTTFSTSNRTFERVVAYNGYIYVVGSDDSFSSAVPFAPLASNGTVGTWGTAANLNTAVFNVGVGFMNGYMYVIGGEANDANNGSTLTQYAKVNSDGTLGVPGTNVFVTNTALTARSNKVAFAQYDNKFYMINGAINGSRSLTTSMISVNGGGGGTTDAWTTGSTTMSESRDSGATVAYNGYLYAVGGKNGTTYYNDVSYAPLNSDGSVGTWTVDTHTFTTGRKFLGAAAHNGYMYVLGGKTSAGGTLQDIQYAPIGGSGALSGNWASAGSSISTGGQGTSLAIYKGYAYAVGGYNGTSYSTTVYYAPVNTDGTIGSWSTTSSFTTARYNAATVVYNDNLYLVGGADSAAMNDVQYAAINSNGTLGTWAASTDIEGARMCATIGATNGFMYVLGGTDAAGTAEFGDVHYAPINTFGGVGMWHMTKSLASGTTVTAPGVIYKGFMYAVGGIHSSTEIATAQYAPINSIARWGSYSKLVDLTTTYNISSVAYNGTLSPSTTVQYKAAGSDGVLSSLTAATAGTGATTPVCSAASTRYVWLLVTFDDGTTDQYDNITDMTVNYSSSARPQPASRLYGGKSFAFEAQLPLDTCGP
jgi:hypothetical protein